MEFSDRPEDQKATIRRIHQEAERENAENDRQENRNYRKYTRKLLNNTYARNRKTYRSNRNNLEASIRRKTERSEGEVSEAEHALLTRQLTTEKELRTRMLDIENARQRQLDADALVYCQNKSANSMEEWVAARVHEFKLPLDGNIHPSEFNDGHPPYPSELVNWTIIYASGNSNNCLVHSILTLTSYTFRQLSDENKNRLAQAFREGPFLEIPNLNENQRARLEGNVFLDDTDLIRLERCYKLNILLITQLQAGGQRVEQVLGNLDYPDQPVYFIFNEGNAHYEPLQNPDGTFVMNYAEALALRDRYAPGAEGPPAPPPLISGSDSEVQTLKGQIDAVDKVLQGLQTQIQQKDKELHEVKQYDIHDNEELILGEMKAIYKKLRNPFNNKLEIKNNAVVDNKGVVVSSLQNVDIFFIGKNVPSLYGILYTNFKKYLSDYGTGLQKQTNILNEIEALNTQKAQAEANKRTLETQLVSLTQEIIKPQEQDISLKAKEERYQQALILGRNAAELEIQRLVNLGEKKRALIRDNAMEAAVKAVVNAKLAINPNEGLELAEYIAILIGNDLSKDYKLSLNPVKATAKSLSLSVKRDMIEDIPALQEPLIGTSFLDILKTYKLKHPIITNATFTDKIRVESEERQTKKQQLQQKLMNYEVNKQEGVLRPDGWQRELWNPQDGNPIPGTYPEKVNFLIKECELFAESQEPPLNSLLGIDYGLDENSKVYDFIHNVFMNPLITTEEMVSYRFTKERTPGCDAYEILAMLFVLFGGIPHINPRDGGNYTFCDKIEVTSNSGFKFLPKYGNLHLLMEGGARATSQNGKSDVTLFLNDILDPKRREGLITTDLPNKKVYKMSVKYFGKEISQEKYDIEGLSIQKVEHIPLEHMGIIVFVKDRGAFIQKCRDVKSGRYGTIELCEKIYGWEQNVKPFIHDVRNTFFTTATRLGILPIELFKDIFDIS